MSHDRESTFKQLDKLLADPSVPVLPLNGRKYVAFSDSHLGDGKKADDFRNNEDAMVAALEHYRQAGYHLILLGDIEEFWQFDLTPIIEQYGNTVYRSVCAFGPEGVTRVYGNHDIDWRTQDDPARDGLSPQVNATEAVKLGDGAGKVKFLLVHGHQGSTTSDKQSWSSRFWVRCFKKVEPLAKKLGITTHPPAARSQVTRGYEKIFYDWAKAKGMNIICGHSHHAIYASKSYYTRCQEEITALEADTRMHPENREENRKTIKKLKKAVKREKKRQMNRVELDPPAERNPCYYNSGCALLKDGITAVELDGEEIRLVKWNRDVAADPRREQYQAGHWRWSH